MKGDTYYSVDRGTRYETRIKRCGICGVTQAKRPQDARFGPCPYKALHKKGGDT